MDILVTDNGEVAVIDAQIDVLGGGFVLSTGAAYPPDLVLMQNVEIPIGLHGRRLSYVNGVFAELPEYPKPMPPVPQSIDPLKAIYLLDQMGFGAAYTAWRDAPERTLIERETLLRAPRWERNDSTLTAAATAMGITSDQLDQMFVQVGY